MSVPPKPKALRDGRYTLIRPLGAGSQAETFEARDHGITRGRPDPARLAEDWQRYVGRARRGETPNPAGLVAVKAFHVGKAKAWKDVELAEREARTLAALAHPNLPRYIEHFEEDGALYLVMEMVEGESLASLRARQRTSSVAEVTRMLHDIADALRYLHGRAPPVVHRDIKPGNIIRRPDGSYALVDFGAVRDRLKPEGGSTVVGTFGYMAPEQFQGRASPRSDLYGLGATALVMLTGVEPEDLPHVGLGIDVAKALPSNTPAGLLRALEALLDPDPDRRAASIDDALALLRERPAAPRAAPPEPPPPAAPPALTKKERKEALRAERRRLGALARARRAPFVPRVLGQLALFVALLVVWLTVGLVLPLVLVILSLIFGGALRRAAQATRRAAARSRASLLRGSSWLAGYRAEDLAPEARVRVEEIEGRMRVEADEGLQDHGEEETDVESVPEPLRRPLRRS
ncbi:MAG TPA: serine/threonine-protein kinase [Labilithrix sp.]|nr:serine/threonine-protein kinase [Labilithrix sp.]